MGQHRTAKRPGKGQWKKRWERVAGSGRDAGVEDGEMREENGWLEMSGG